VARTSDEDLFTVVDTVQEYVREKQLPPGYRLRVWSDVSVDVRDRIELLTRNGLQGLLLVFLVLAIFLELRLAFWVALGIPISILAAGFILLMTGQTLNMLSMFAFLMALGIVVDDAIVIGENIYHKRQTGMGPVRAAVEGTCEVLPSVCASVTTTIIAFAPLMFITGVMGKFLAVMPVAVIAMLIVSLIESMLILPCHLAHENNLFLRILGRIFYIFTPLLVPFRKLNDLASRGMDWAVARIYTPLLKWSLHNKSLVISGCLSLIILSVGVILAGWVPFEAFPKLDARRISGTVVFPDGTASFEAEQATLTLQNTLYDVCHEYEQETGEKVLNVVYQRVGEVGNSLGGPTGVTNGSHVGTVEAELVQPDERTITSQQVIERWRKRLLEEEIAGTDVIKFGSASMGPGGNKIEFKLLATSDSVEWLEPAAEDAKAWLASIKGVTDIEDDLRLGKYEMIISLNDKGRSLNLDESRLTRTVRAAYFGEEVMRLQRGRHEVKLMVRFPEKDRKSMESFEEIRIRDANGVERPLTAVADVSFRRASSEINRLNGKRSITITADVDKSEGANAFNIVQQMRNEFIPELLKQYKADYGATLYVNWEGEQQQTMESFSSMGVGFIIALLLIFVLLTLEFRSYAQPAIILSIIPFGFIGAVAGHVLMGLEMTMFSMFGLIALTGVVINDSIVLVDFINHRVRDGIPLTEALIDAGRRRFRPIMLTSITTVAGLSPMLMETSLQAQVLIPMAASLVFGLMAGTLLILILVPVFYDIYGILINIEQQVQDEQDDYQKALQDAAAGTPPTLQPAG
jgi:multidrug efflux pump subunit AcrB